MPRRIGVSCLLMVLASTVPAVAQVNARFDVALRINQDVEQFSGQVIAASRDPGVIVYTAPAGNGLGNGLGWAPGNVLFKIETVRGVLLEYRVTVDSNGDGDLRDETSQVVTADSSIIVKVNRKWRDKPPQGFTYTVKYSTEKRGDGHTYDRFTWFAHYRAEGRLKVKRCDVLLSVLDLNGDGRFDSEDSLRGTNIGLDRNGDGRFWGVDEYLTGNQIIEYCDDAFLVDRLGPDGASISFSATTLRVPKVGYKLPTFSLNTTDGRSINSATLRNKVHLLDFWASWCKPCVEKFSFLKRLAGEFKDDVSIVAVNVDDESALPTARKIVKDYGLAWPHVMSGRGETDPVWKMFGAIGTNRLSIPLYVLVDGDGRLRYAGNGGADLSTLRTEIERLLGK